MNQGSERAASYLETRRQRRLRDTGTISMSEGDDEFDDSLVQVVCTPPAPPSFFNSDAFWFTLSGIVLGIAISIVAAIIKRATEKQ